MAIIGKCPPYSLFPIAGHNQVSSHAKLDRRQCCVHNVKNCNISKCQIENNTPCVYAIDFRRSTMLAYIYHGHSIAYDPIYDRLQQQQATKQQIKNVVCKNNIYIYRLLYC